jgi:hypothetical protein
VGDIRYSIGSTPEGWVRLFRAWSYFLDRESSGLRFLVPETLRFQETAYGQGEGLALVNGLELGFYQTETQHLSLVLHGADEATDLRLATGTIERICQHWSSISGESFHLERQEDDRQ